MRHFDLNYAGIRANPNNAVAQGFANGINSGILRYVGAPAQEPNTTQDTAQAPLVEANLVVCASEPGCNFVLMGFSL
jgi:hypothetical protein